MKVLFSTIIVTIWCFGCYQKPSADDTTPSLSGIWWYVENDSVYGEVIFTNDHLWEYSEHAGVYYVAYKIKDDSIYLANSITARIDKILKDEFSLVRPRMTTQYKRLSIPLDTGAILHGDEEVLEDYVINGFRRREIEWGIKHFPSRYQIKK